MPRQNTWLRGERSPNHKLTERQARLILEHRYLPQRMFARAFGVTLTVVIKIRSGKAWGWLKHPNAGLPQAYRGQYWADISNPLRHELARIERLWRQGEWGLAQFAMHALDKRVKRELGR